MARVGAARVVAALLLGLALVSLFPLAAPSAAGPRFTVAILRRDGVIVPFATFDGSRWSNRWPATQARDIPIGLRDVPTGWWPNGAIVTNWTAWPVSGPRRAITASAPVQVNVHCTRRVGLRTDFRSPELPPPNTFQPYPKSGLATSGNVAVERVELVPLPSPEASGFSRSPSIATAVSDAETDSVLAWQRTWQHPVGIQGRTKTPLTLEVLVRTPGVTPGSTIYYFEGVKKYRGFMQPNAPNVLIQGKAAALQSCDYLTFAGGWCLLNEKREALRLSVGADLTNCNREGVAYGLPLGAIRLGERLFWVVQTSGWDFERYDVVEIGQKSVTRVLSVGGGSCR
jgi:hypothetical protein